MTPNYGSYLQRASHYPIGKCLLKASRMRSRQINKYGNHSQMSTYFLKNIFISVGECCAATCEIEVDLRDGRSTLLSVVDVLEFSPDAHITAVRAINSK